MKLLMDTHTFIWLDTAPDRLSPAALAACEDPNNQLYLSVISAWEIQIKVQLGRLKFDLPWEQMVEVQEVENGMQILPVTLSHISALSGLPQLHGILLIACLLPRLLLSKPKWSVAIGGSNIIRSMSFGRLEVTRFRKGISRKIVSIKTEG